MMSVRAVATKKLIDQRPCMALRVAYSAYPAVLQSRLMSLGSVKRVCTEPSRLAVFFFGEKTERDEFSSSRSGICNFGRLYRNVISNDPICVALL
jgi:hypothetical protein